MILQISNVTWIEALMLLRLFIVVLISFLKICLNFTLNSYYDVIKRCFILDDSLWILQNVFRFILITVQVKCTRSMSI